MALDAFQTAAIGVGANAGAAYLNNQGTQSGNNAITVKGKTDALKSILDQIMQSTTASGMATMVGNTSAVGKAVVPDAVLGTTGAPVQTPEAIKALQDDMSARLGNVATALLNNQQNLAAGVATKYADATKTQTVVQSSGGCFITTAICEGLGLPDDCEELQVLRAWRDSYLVNTEDGKESVQLYYDVAPILLEQLRLKRVGKGTLDYIRVQYIVPAVAAIKSGEDEFAVTLYVEMLRYVIDVLELV